MRASSFLFLLIFAVKVFGQSTTNTNQTNSQTDKSPGGVTLPDGTFIPNTPKKVSNQNNNQVAAVGSGSTGALQDGTSKVTYDSLKRLYERQKTVSEYVPDAEKLIYNDSMNLLDAYFKAFEEGNVEATRQLFERSNDKTKDLLKNKSIVAFRYNEIFKKMISSDVRFGIYKDSDEFYLAVGEDAFKTVSTLSVENILGILQAYEKAMKWLEQCYNEKMNVTKPLGNFGGVSIEFDSKDDGKFCRFVIHIKGQMTSDRLISEQTVWMTILNFSCLVDKMQNAPEMYQKHKKAKENAGKLK